jgi:hypothetical protein
MLRHEYEKAYAETGLKFPHKFGAFTKDELLRRAGASYALACRIYSKRRLNEVCTGFAPDRYRTLIEWMLKNEALVTRYARFVNHGLNVEIRHLELMIADLKRQLEMLKVRLV